MADNRPNFQTFFDALSSACAILDGDLVCLDCNPAFVSVMHCDRDALLGRYIFDVFPETEERVAHLKGFFESAVEGEMHVLRDVPYHIDVPAGEGSEPESGMEEHFWRVHVGPLPVPGSDSKLWMLRIENVSDEVAERRARDTVAGELQHRMGNLLNLIMVIARRTAASAINVDDFLERYGARINSLSNTYKALTGKNWDGLTLREIAEQELEAYREKDETNVTFEGHDVKLSAVEAQAISMALHELTTNAAKYGALHHPGAKLRLSWQETTKKGFELEWAETGLSGLTEPVVEGFGSMILTRILPSQMNGDADRTFSDTAFTYRLRVPNRASAASAGNATA